MTLRRPWIRPFGVFGVNRFAAMFIVTVSGCVGDAPSELGLTCEAFLRMIEDGIDTLAQRECDSDSQCVVQTYDWTCDGHQFETCPLVLSRDDASRLSLGSFDPEACTQTLDSCGSSIPDGICGPPPLVRCDEGRCVPVD